MTSKQKTSQFPTLINEPMLKTMRSFLGNCGNPFHHRKFSSKCEVGNIYAITYNKFSILNFNVANVPRKKQNQHSSYIRKMIIKETTN
jgi:hypothetical protein